MESDDENLQINKKPRLVISKVMSQEQVSDEGGAGNSNNIEPNDTAINDMADQIELVHLIDDKVDCMGGEIEILQRGIASLAEQIDARDLYSDLLAQSLVKKDKDIDILRKKVYDLEKRSMNKNVYIRNLSERPREVPLETVQSYLRNNNIDSGHYDIEVAHRNGKFDGKNARQRPMIVQFGKRDQVDLVMEGTKNEGDYNKDHTRVTRQVPTESRHATAKLYHLAHLIKENHPHANVTVKDKNIYVNNNKRRPPVTPPTMQQTLTTDINEIDILNNVSFFASDLIGMKASTFRAFISPAYTAEDARYAYLAVSRFPGVASASHLISAYYTMNDEFDYLDDGDHGLGHHVFEIMQAKGIRGVIIFLSRDFGGIHLGKDRFLMINKVVAQALGKYNAAVQRNPNIQQPARLQIYATFPTPSNTRADTGATSQPNGPDIPDDDRQHQNAASAQPQGSSLGDNGNVEHKGDGDPNVKKNEDGNGSENMDVDIKQQEDVDQTKHKTTYKGSPINQHSRTQMGAAVDYGGQPRGGTNNRPPPPFSQLPGSTSQPQSPIVLKQDGNESISLPTIRKGNVFHQMMLAKQTRQNKTKNKRGKKDTPFSLKPIPGITKIKSPTTQVVNASKLTNIGSPKRDRDTMEEKTTA
jgi:hypothetical protein